MNVYLKHLSDQYPQDHILLICDNAGWHKSKDLAVPDNITIAHIPPYTPEMNPVEQVWEEIKEKNFANRVFDSLQKVSDKLCESVKNLSLEALRSITLRGWIAGIFT